MAQLQTDLEKSEQDKEFMEKVMLYDCFETEAIVLFFFADAVYE